MNAISSVTQETFRRYFVSALVSIGIPISQANSFCCINQTKRIMDMKICTVISMKIDEFMEARIPDYKGFLPKDTWTDIINYNFSDD